MEVPDANTSGGKRKYDDDLSNEVGEHVEKKVATDDIINEILDGKVLLDKSSIETENHIDQEAALDDTSDENDAAENIVDEDNSNSDQLDPDVLEKANFVVGEYELLKRILTHLPPYALANCCRVCKCWNKAATKVMKENEADCKPLTFWWKPSVMKKVDIEENMEDFRSRLTNFRTRKLYFKPKCILMFCSFDQTEHFYTDFHQSFEEQFTGIPVISGVSTGLIGTDNSGVCQESESGRRNIKVTILFIPPWKNLNVKTLGSDECTPILEVPQSDAAIIFTDDNEIDNISVKNADLAMGGAIIDHMFNATRCLLLDNVSSGVVLLDRTVKTEQKVRKELLKLKGTFDEKNGFGLMFACCGRGKYFYKGKPNFESKIFQSIFPKVPLVGFFGNGEIGFNSKNTFSDSDDYKEKVGKLKLNEVFHAFTSVFMVFSSKTGSSTS